MSKQKRIEYSQAQNVALVTQVNSVCPLCDEQLFYKKAGKSYKAYQIAHIYPLNPTDMEIELLRGEERLGGTDVNAEANVIPLCDLCHAKFDKPRTVEEYRKLLTIKKRLIEKSGQESLWKQHPIEESIRSIIECLYAETTAETDLRISYNPKSIDQKTDETITQPTIRKIKNNVSDYYTLIRKQLANLDKSSPGASEIISLQVKAYYLRQKQLKISKQSIFDNIVEWVNVKTKPESIDAAEIITSFFVQNCEVFE